MKSKNKTSHLWVGQLVSDTLNSAARFRYVVMALEIASFSLGIQIKHKIHNCLVSHSVFVP